MTRAIDRFCNRPVGSYQLLSRDQQRMDMAEWRLATMGEEDKATRIAAIKRRELHERMRRFREDG